ncbi:MAG: addiction module protein [Lysobacterales bacterium]
MVASARELFETALNLSDKERAELVSLLLTSLDIETEDGVEAAWFEEISRRVAELDSGTVQAIGWAQVQAEAFEVADR